jgi:rhodanese-related sulfurtransferase
MKCAAVCFVALGLLFPLPLSAQDKEPEHTKDTLETVKKNVETEKAVIVDVREDSEWKAGHVAGAIHLPSSKLNLDSEVAELIKKLPKDKVIYTHCKAGGRALRCGEILKKQGFDVRPLKPGYEELLKAGFKKAE